MSTRIVCVDPNAVGPYARELETGQVARLGDEIEIENLELAESLLAQESVWARPNSNAAKDAKKAIASWRKLDGAEEASAVASVAPAEAPGLVGNEHAAAAVHKEA